MADLPRRRYKFGVSANPDLRLADLRQANPDILLVTDVGPDTLAEFVGREARIHRLPPGPDRWKLRSITYAGIAAAMADQWGRVEADLFAGVA